MGYNMKGAIALSSDGFENIQIRVKNAAQPVKVWTKAEIAELNKQLCEDARQKLDKISKE